MYNIAYVDNDKCIAEKGCRLCIMYCPEADTIMLDEATKKAIVIELASALAGSQNTLKSQGQAYSS